MKEVNYKDLKFNPFNLIGGEWMMSIAKESYDKGNRISEGSNAHWTK